MPRLQLTPLPGGGSGGGAVLRSFSFAFDTPELLTGVDTGYSPTVGEYLLDAWFEVVEAWDGTTPLADFGAFLNGEAFGCFGYQTGATDLTKADRSDANFMPSGLATADNNNYGLFQAMLRESSTERAVPAKFTDAGNIKIVVSQDGQLGGADPEATQGSAILYLLTAAPLT